MNLTLRLRLLPTDEERAGLLSVMERFNEAANFAACVGFEAKVFSQISIHKRAYREIRKRFDLSAQLAVRAIGKAVEVFKRDRSVCPVFKPRGAITYDERILSFKGLDKVSLTTLDGREVIAMVFGEYQGKRLDRIRGQVDLVYSAGQFHLYATVNMPEEPPIEIRDFLGIDLGIKNIATDSDSDGNRHPGAPVEEARRRYHSNRERFQACGTRSAKRRLQRNSRRESRFRKDVNHVLSKRIVQSAKGTGRGIALEDLAGIRDRTTVRHKDRAKHSGWAFFQLRSFIEYKARLAGVPVVMVDPRNTSRTCSACGHCEKANRRSQAEFMCKRCGFAIHADYNGALNVRHRGILSYPDLAASGLGDLPEGKSDSRKPLPSGMG
jgi:IS605 OrfB family transposase